MVCQNLSGKLNYTLELLRITRLDLLFETEAELSLFSAFTTLLRSLLLLAPELFTLGSRPFASGGNIVNELCRRAQYYLQNENVKSRGGVGGSR